MVLFLEGVEIALAFSALGLPAFPVWEELWQCFEETCPAWGRKGQQPVWF